MTAPHDTIVMDTVDPGLTRARKREILLDVGLTIASMLVLVIAALYVVAPPAYTMAAEVSTSATAAGQIVVYGSVLDTDGRPVRSATVVVSRQDGETLTRVLTIPVAADGTFRGETTAVDATYRVTVSADVGGRIARDTLALEMTAGHAYGMNIELIGRDYFVFLPIPSY